MSSNIIQSYLAQVKAARQYRELEINNAVSALNQEKIVHLFKVEPSLTKYKPTGGGTLLHTLFKVPIVSEEDEARMYLIMTTLYAWGVEFHETDCDGKTARSYIKTSDILEGYDELCKGGK
jgi:hypothetical protein